MGITREIRLSNNKSNNSLNWFFILKGNVLERDFFEEEEVEWEATQNEARAGPADNWKIANEVEGTGRGGAVQQAAGRPVKGKQYFS